MFRKKKPDNGDGANLEGGYALDWPVSDPWKPGYIVPRNSVEAGGSDGDGQTRPPVDARHYSYGRRRDVDTRYKGSAPPLRGAGVGARQEEQLSSLAHWLETTAELYMNELDNLARWDPRWLNVTRRERFEGLESASVTVVDFLAGDRFTRSERPISDEAQLAAALRTRPADSELRVIVASDVSRLVMGALGQLLDVDPEFWFEHLAGASGYGGGDVALKVKNAVWMNWAERETRFRHRALPGPGQRTEWTLPRRWRRRLTGDGGGCGGGSWAHLRWGRLGVMHYLGRKGFFEDEMQLRLADGRWVMERDVLLDRHGYLITHKRQAMKDAKAKAKAYKEERRRKSRSRKAKNPEMAPGHNIVIHPSLDALYVPPPGAAAALASMTDTNDTPPVISRSKTTNVYRAYSTFESLPRAVGAWKNRDLRVLAPEGASYWSGRDSDGRKTVIMLLDPVRQMRHSKTMELTPSLTFMPRPSEIELYDDEELWREPESGETFLDPPPLLKTLRELRMRKLKGRQRRLREQLRSKTQRETEKMPHGESAGKGDDEEEYDDDDDISEYSSGSSDGDGTYVESLRKQYDKPSQFTRDRDFARKYTLSTHDLILRHLAGVRTSDVATDDSVLPSILSQVALDDQSRVLAEMRLSLDHLDGDFAGDLHLHLVESIGITTRQQLYWMRSMLRELREWAGALAGAAATPPTPTTGAPPKPRLDLPEPLREEVSMMLADLDELRARAEGSLNLLVASTGIAQSSLVIDQTSGVNKLTELAFFFVPLSFITAVFSMQVVEFTADPPPLRTWAITLAAVFSATYLLRAFVRSPSVRLFGKEVRVTLLNRWTPGGSESASNRLNSVSSRAIIRFTFALLVCLMILIPFKLVQLAAIFMLMIGLWLGAAAVALYFIVTRWPDTAVLGPCFVSLPLAATGMAVCWYWSGEILIVAENWTHRALRWIERLLPAQWMVDNVDDADLAKEGVKTYVRQAMVMAAA